MYRARLVVLHVLQPIPAFAGEGMFPPTSEDIRAEANDRLDRLQVPHADVRAEWRLVKGDAVTGILRSAGEVGADLIVIGTHGRTGLERVLMGSVAEQVVRRAACPVVTVTRPVPADPGSPGTPTP